MTPTLWAILLCVVVGLAYCGKGGLFAQWGIKGGNWQHGLGALLVGLALSSLTGWAMAFNLLGVSFWLPSTPIFALLWFGYTRPTPHLLFQTLDLPTERQRLRAIPLAYLRQAYMLPELIAVWYAGSGTLWALIGFLPLGWIYFAGGIVQRRTGFDGVKASEIMTAYVGLLFFGLAYPLM